MQYRKIHVNDIFKNKLIHYQCTVLYKANLPGTNYIYLYMSDFAHCTINHATYLFCSLDTIDDTRGNCISKQ